MEVLALGLKALAHPFADGHGLLGHGLRVGHGVLHDGLEELVLVLPFERRLRDRGSLVGTLPASPLPRPAGPSLGLPEPAFRGVQRPAAGVSPEAMAVGGSD